MGSGTRNRLNEGFSSEWTAMGRRGQRQKQWDNNKFEDHRQNINNGTSLSQKLKN